MSAVKEITVFSIGNSRRMSSWSNVPYFFTETLVSKGIKVNRVNIDRSFIGKALNKTLWAALNIVNQNSYYDYSRSWLHYCSSKLKIKWALERFSKADANIFLTFSFSSVGMTDKPTVLFCDWTYDHHFKYFLNKEPNPIERASIEREDRQIEGAELVFVLFPRVAEYMKSRYRNKNIFYLGNVVNTLLNVTEARILKDKAESQQLLFIGGSKYREGALQLIEAYKLLKADHPALTLNIIGMKEKEFDALPAGVRCHGYLDKERQAERELYYSLLSNAKVLVNTTPKWGAFSATLEAMHFYTPVITTPYPEFVETFGRSIDFGRYCENSSLEFLRSCIADLISSQHHESLCVRAHAAVKDCTWGAYIDKMLVKLNQVTVADRKHLLRDPDPAALAGGPYRPGT